jgi:hypothetical protein
MWTVVSEAVNTNVIVFGLTRLEMELTIYHIRCDHANHYTTELVSLGERSGKIETNN